MLKPENYRISTNSYDYGLRLLHKKGEININFKYLSFLNIFMWWTKSSWENKGSVRVKVEKIIANEKIKGSVGAEANLNTNGCVGVEVEKT